ncbi:hypothetical protein FA15DRAFT_710943 [Coprinopsis marcescibilis]|uniref:Uncharacterized protein n=1 Tax=Coprinopsis marcescibilis TaxID=230819 RepID=A0A5C3KB40_COPMA|nr:hypothetical protein FA15DRAFT_710943 [Coprinopsis marcescibilis]
MGNVIFEGGEVFQNGDVVAFLAGAEHDLDRKSLERQLKNLGLYRDHMLSADEPDNDVAKSRDSASSVLHALDLDGDNNPESDGLEPDDNNPAQFKDSIHA